MRDAPTTAMRALVLLAGIACGSAFQSPTILQRTAGASRCAAAVRHGRHRARSLAPVSMAATTAVYADKVRLNHIRDVLRAQPMLAAARR
jgi:F0F1-type ATP synthase membrane subunit c/vacuolar-type H+-ATPase subunit K